MQYHAHPSNDQSDKENSHKMLLFLFLFNDLFTGDFLANRNIANFSFVVFFLDKFQSVFFVLNEQNEFNVLTTMNDMRA